MMLETLNESTTEWLNTSFTKNSTFIGNSSLITFSSDEDDEEFHEFTRAVSISVFCTFGFIFLIGLIGNILVVTVVAANPMMRSTTNILILNLAVSDLLFVIFCVPFTATDYVLDWWPFGDFICRFVQYMIVVTCHASIYTLIMMSLDRYLAVVHPITSMSIRTERNALLSIKIAWILIILTAFPWFLVHGEAIIKWDGDSPDEVLKCVFLDGDGYNKPFFQITFFMTSYFIPLTIISALYVCMLAKLWRGQTPGSGKPLQESRRRGKKRVTQMIVAVVLAFAMCWAPIHIVLILKTLFPHFESRFLIKVQIVSHILAYCSSCINPILYAFLSENFRKAFRKVVKCGEAHGRASVSTKDIQLHTMTKLSRPTNDQSIDIV